MIIQSQKDFENAIEYIRSSEILALDCETTGLQPKTDEIIGFSFSNSNDSGFYYCHKAWDGSKLVLPSSDFDPLLLLKEIAKKPTVYWNASFDIRFILNYFKIDLRENYHADVMLMKHTCDENHFSYALKQTAKELYGVDAADEQVELKKSIRANGGNPTDFFKASTDIMAKYAVKDTQLTWKLYHYYYKELQKQNLVNFFFKEEVHPLHKDVTIEMENRGVPLNLPLMQSTLKSITNDINNLELKIRDQIKNYVVDYEQKIINKKYPVSTAGDFAQMLCKLEQLDLPKTKTGKYSLSKDNIEKLPDNHIKKFLQGVAPLVPETRAKEVQRELFNTKEGTAPFNLRSKHHLKYLFFKVLKQTPINYTDKGSPQVDELFLDSIKLNAGMEWVQDLILFNKLGKIKSTYIERFLEKQVNGVFYPSYQQHRTISGRYGSDLQQLNRPFEKSQLDSGEVHPLLYRYNNVIRKFFVAAEGWSFIDSDYCLHPKTELLTKKRGWVPVLELLPEDKVWQVDAITEEGSWCVPSRIIKKNYNGEMYTFGNRRGTLSVTKNHTMLWVGQNHKTRLDKKAYRNIQLSQNLIPTTGCNFLNGSSKYKTNIKKKLNKKELRLAALISADGHKIKNRKNYYKIEVSKPIKVKKITDMLGSPNSTRSANKNQNYDPKTWFVKFKSKYLNADKSLNLNIISPKDSDFLLECLAEWDGHIDKHKAVNWGSINKNFVEKIQAFFVKCGYEAKLNIKYYENINHNTFYYLRIKKENRIRVRKIDYKIEKYIGKVGCVTVDTGFILVRSKGQTFVTGNCSLEPHIFSHVTGDKGLQEIFNKNLDFYSMIAIKTEKLKNVSANPIDKNYLGKVNKPLRQKAKAYCLGVPYGLEAFKLSHQLNCTPEEADALINDYLDGFPQLKQWMQDSNRVALEKGFIQSQAGRIRHLNEAVKLFNEHQYMFDGYKLKNSLDLYKHFDGMTDYNGVKVKTKANPRYKAAKQVRRKISNLLNNAKNFQIQSLAASIVNRAAIEINRELKRLGSKGYVCAQVHDQLVIHLPDSDAQKYRKTVQYIMENVFSLDVKLKAPPEIAKDFYEGH